MHQFRLIKPKWYAALVVVVLISECQIEASKSSNHRKSNNHHGTTGRTQPNTRHGPNLDHVRLTHGEAAAPKQSHIPQQHAPPPSHTAAYPHPQPQPRPSAPELPSNAGTNKPIGWNVGHGDAQQKQTVSNTQSQPHPQGHNPSPYQPYGSNAAPPPYSASGNVPHVNAAPPPYTPNAGAVPNYPGE